jgi:mRNA interferase MazF
MERKRVIYPKRGDIYLVNFDPTIGSEINKTRPALIIQNDTSNQYSPVTIVAAITSSISETKVYPTEVFLCTGSGGLKADSLVLLNQIRTIDKLRLVKKLGSLSPKTMSMVNRAVKISLDTETIA